MTKVHTQKQRMRDLMRTADRLLAITADGLENTAPDNFTALKNAAGILKELKDITMMQSPADDREQEARIAGLLKKAESDHGKAAPTEVVIAAEAEGWCS